VEGKGDDNYDRFFQASQAAIFTGAVPLVEVDHFGDASSLCKTAVKTFASISGMLGTNETCAGPKSSDEIQYKRAAGKN
jgi:hypothetical protein